MEESADDRKRRAEYERSTLSFADDVPRVFLSSFSFLLVNTITISAYHLCNLSRMSLSLFPKYIDDYMEKKKKNFAEVFKSMK